MWTFEDILRLTRALSARADDCSFTLAIGGRIVKDEASPRVRLYAIPLTKDHDLDGFMKSLSEIWGEGEERDIPMWDGNREYIPPARANYANDREFQLARQVYDEQYTKEVYAGKIRRRVQFERPDGHSVEIWVL